MTSSHTVLIVEGSPYVRDSLAGLLGGIPGVTVVGRAGNAARGWQLFQECPPTVVLLDVELPEMSGLHLLGQIRQEAATCLVIALSRDVFPALRKQCEELGADHLLDKAREFAELPRLLNQPRTGRLAPKAGRSQVAAPLPAQVSI